MRVGRVVRVVPDRSFGFIQADEFREDVFFHFSVVEKGGDTRQPNPEYWEMGQEVEFELNELLRIDAKLLQASKVKIATRPRTVTLDETADRQFLAKHHPKARRRKPTWRAGRQVEAEPQDNLPPAAEASED